jgi:hypothetical protein
MFFACFACGVFGGSKVSLGVCKPLSRALVYFCGGLFVNAFADACRRNVFKFQSRKRKPRQDIEDGIGGRRKHFFSFSQKMFIFAEH